MSYANNDPSEMEKQYDTHLEKVDADKSATLQRAEEDPAQIKRILRKCDMRILPVMSILYLLSFLDRTAIGNARIAGLSVDLGMTPMEYNLTVTVFFILYGLLEVPSNLMLKKFGASKWLSFIMFWWGTIMTLTALVKTFEGLLVARLFLGAAEAGLFPGVTYYLTTWYKRSESQFRVGFFFGAATIAGAFGGLLAYGLTRIEAGSIPGWGWLFLVEGLLTVAAAIMALFTITDSPDKAKWLTHEEQQILIERLKYDGVDVPMSNDFQWRFVADGFLDWKIWMCFVIYVCILTPVYSVALNLPSITVGLGYSGPNAQLITVPVYIFAAICVIVLALIADKYRARSAILLFGMTVSLVGYIILYASYTSGVRYFGAFLAAAGSYGAFPSIVVLTTNNVGGQTKRATQIAILVGIGGMCGMISSNIFRARDAPHYGFGCMVNIGLLALGIVVTIINGFFLMMANKNKQKMIDSGEATKIDLRELADLGDRNPYFKYTI